MSKYLIITGGSRGIGAKTIAHFQERGWTSINISRSPCTLADVINVNIDLSDSANIEKHTAFFSDLVKDATTLCLVHNAALYKVDAVPTLSLYDLQLAFETNVKSPAALNKIFIPFMPAGSSIIYLGSTLAEKAVPGNASYIVSKHAAVGLMKATCQDLIGKNIHTCCICPGLVDTQLLKATMPPETIAMLLDTKIIGGRLIEPIEIAKTIYFCATTTIINGVTLHANTGQVAD
jgi:3-oxoacyl-[acyl-carrier protein] reductase